MGKPRKRRDGQALTPAEEDFFSKHADCFLTRSMSARALRDIAREIGARAERVQALATAIASGEYDEAVDRCDEVVDRLLDVMPDDYTAGFFPFLDLPMFVCREAAFAPEVPPLAEILRTIAARGEALISKFEARDPAVMAGRWWWWHEDEGAGEPPLPAPSSDDA